MSVLFCVRPATRNIGNDIINKATADLLYAGFGEDLVLVNVPAIAGQQFGGFTAKQVYDMNRLADGVVVGGGNLFENGQISIDPQALAVLQPPLMLIGVSHGRIYDRGGVLRDRTDSMSLAAIELLVSKACIAMVRDQATHSRLVRLGLANVELAGCPTLFLPANPPGTTKDDTVMLSIRHPARMSVPPTVQWRVVDDVRRLLQMLKESGNSRPVLACHDYADIEFARGFSEVPLVYYDDTARYIAALRKSRLNITYRLHGLLPCLAFGTPCIHLSYDERGRSMLATVGMSDWDIDILSRADVVDTVARRIGEIPTYEAMRAAALPIIAQFRRKTEDLIAAFAKQVEYYRSGRR